MKVAWRMMLGLAAAFAVIAVVQADDKDKEKTLKGTITCAKCDLKLEKKCATVIKVPKDKKDKDSKDVVYYFDTDSGKKHHKTICMEPKKGTVTGVVSEKDGKQTVKVSKVEFDEKDKDK
jgi:hypothetical protein